MDASLKRTFHVIGLMSGTSLDGLDIAFCTFRKKDDGSWIYKIEVADCIEYTAEWKNKLSAAHLLSGHDVLVLHKSYGKLLGEKVNAFLEKTECNPDFISSHGHTIFHEPDQKLTFQLGDGAAIYAETGIPVICDFRSVDVAFGGQGAPLVPIGDELLFPEYDYCLNLGGIANISYQKEGKRLAYDVCGCNLLLNHYAGKAGKAFDEGGEMARRGKINAVLLEALDGWKYFQLPPPKSLDKETMLAQMIPLIDSFNLSPEEVLATLSEQIGIQIGNATSQNTGTMLITGGGAFNDFLLEKIGGNGKATIIVPQKELVQYKEALIFAFLGVLRARNEYNGLASVTGAENDTVCGSIYGPIDLYLVKPDNLKGKITFILMFLGFLVFLLLIVFISLRMVIYSTAPHLFPH